MKKDTIYIDIEDDITGIIGKLKNSTEKVVALVPPKGNQVMQSIVNLKLLKRAAEHAGKQPVLVTSSKSLTTLAGGLGMYTARNLQSKPVLAEAEAEDPNIDDEAVEVSDTVEEADAGEVVIEPTDGGGDKLELNEDDMAALEKEDGATQTGAAADTTKPPVGKQKKVPNFDTFRKKLLIGAGVFLLLLVPLILIFGQTKADVVVRAETTPVDVMFDSKISADTAQTDPATYTLKAQYQESKKSTSQAFAATGQKDLGTKASGKVDFSIKCSDIEGAPPTIPAGTGVSANNLTFITQQAVSLTTPSFGGGGCRFVGSSPVTAQSNGDQYNLGPQAFSVSGFGSVKGAGSQMSGGTSQIVKVITQGDVDKAKAQIGQQDSAPVREELKKTFGPDVHIFDDSFAATPGPAQSEPGVGEQVNEGKLTVEMTYSMLAVKSDDIKAAIKAFIATKMTAKDQQQAYEDSIKDIQYTRTGGDARNGAYKIASRGQFGPKFNTDELKKMIVGKKAGEIRSTLQGLPGVKSVDIHLWPFWANRAPQADRIQLKVDVSKNIGG